MALIRCKECGKEISDKAKICPHCGYKEYFKLKKIQKINFQKYDLYNTNVIACFLLILSFITSFFNISFSRDNYSSTRQLLIYPFNEMMYYFTDLLHEVYIILGIIAIIMLIYTLIKKELKFKKVYYYIPLFLYNSIALITSFAVMFGFLNEHTLRYDTYYGILWGGIWILIMLTTSSILLIINLIKNSKEQLLKKNSKLLKN